jgi:hypothetical protein
MLQTTTWHPDTCGCVISYQWDDAVPAEQRKHTFASVDSSKCKTAHPPIVLGTQVESSPYHSYHVAKDKAAQV